MEPFNVYVDATLDHLGWSGGINQIVDDLRRTRDNQPKLQRTALPDYRTFKDNYDDAKQLKRTTTRRKVAAYFAMLVRDFKELDLTLRRDEFVAKYPPKDGGQSFLTLFEIITGRNSGAALNGEEQHKQLLNYSGYYQVAPALKRAGYHLLRISRDHARIQIRHSLSSYYTTRRHSSWVRRHYRSKYVFQFRPRRHQWNCDTQETFRASTSRWSLGTYGRRNAAYVKLGYGSIRRSLRD